MLGRNSINVFPGVGDFSFFLQYSLSSSTNKLTVTINIGFSVIACKVTFEHLGSLALRTEADFLTELACEPSVVITGETLAKTHF